MRGGWRRVAALVVLAALTGCRDGRAAAPDDAVGTTTAPAPPAVAGEVALGPDAGLPLAAGAGRIVVRAASADAGGGELRLPDDVLVVDRATGAVEAIALPDGLVVAQATADADGIVVVGGSCPIAQGPADAFPPEGCPETVTASYRRAWAGDRWEEVALPEGAALRAPLVEGGAVAAGADLTPTRTVLLRLAAEGWVETADVAPATGGACTVGEVVWSADPWAGEPVARRVDLATGAVTEVPLPPVPAAGPAGPVWTLGCDGAGPVVVAPARAWRRVGDAWTEVAVPAAAPPATPDRLAGSAAGLAWVAGSTTVVVPTGATEAHLGPAAGTATTLLVDAETATLITAEGSTATWTPIDPGG